MAILLLLLASILRFLCVDPSPSIAIYSSHKILIVKGGNQTFRRVQSSALSSTIVVKQWSIFPSMHLYHRVHIYSSVVSEWNDLEFGPTKWVVVALVVQCDMWL